MYTREIDDLRKVFRGGCDHSKPDDVEAYHDIIERIMALGGDPWCDDRDDDPNPDEPAGDDMDDEEYLH